tara:strand:- start:318 stop:839 length:522 start_codon:yes stop_codon:yes gene_type:complete
MLSSIGSDLSVSVSFSIARELLEGANDEQIAADELISLVLGFAIIFSAIQSRLTKMLGDRRKSAMEFARKHALASVSAEKLAFSSSEVSNVFTEAFVKSAEAEAVKQLSNKRTGLDFLALTVDIMQRILVAISVQLLAASVRAQQESRVVRTVSLIGLAVFFVFVESLTNRHV